MCVLVGRGLKRRVKGIKLGLSGASCCLVSLSYSAPSLQSVHTYSHSDPAILLGVPGPLWNGQRTRLGQRKEERVGSVGHHVA